MWPLYTLDSLYTQMEAPRAEEKITNAPPYNLRDSVSLCGEGEAVKTPTTTNSHVSCCLTRSHKAHHCDPPVPGALHTAAGAQWMLQSREQMCARRALCLRLVQRLVRRMEHLLKPGSRPLAQRCCHSRFFTQAKTEAQGSPNLPKVTASGK